MELAELMEVMVAEVAAETLALLVLSVSLEASTAPAGGVCVGGGCVTEVTEVMELMK